MEPALTAETVIERALRRGARHVRILSVAEGALALALAAGGFLFFEIVLDHLFGIPAGVRTAFFVALVTLVGVVFGWLVLAPLVRSVSSLYIAKRIEAAFPDFKNSLVTFVELKATGDGQGIVRLVAHQAAMRFEGVDIDAGLDSTRFVKLGYCFVALVVVVFAYSLFTPKSMWTSLMRSVYPNAGIAAPTSTHIGGVEPGNARVLLGADVAVSAEVTGGEGEASIKWSRDGELWQSAPMQQIKGRFAGVLGHVETNTFYYISAGDASSGEYTITTLVPPLVESVEVELTPPAYTGLKPVRAAGGNIEGPVGSQAAIEIGSNKELSSVAIKTSAGQTVELAVAGRKASGELAVERSGRYAVILTDSEGLSPARPVEYDIVAIPDRPPLVGVKGPSEKDAVGLDEALGFEFEATDDYGLARLVFHFESNPSNADVKNFILPEGKREVRRSAELVPRLLGATAGDTVSYYLEAFDGQGGKPNASRTATYTFRVAAGRESLSPSTAGAAIPGVKETNSTLPGTAVAASGEAQRKAKGQTNLVAPADGGGAKPAGDPKGDLLKMLDKDRETWDTIAKHYEAVESPSGAAMPKATEKQLADGTKATEAQGAPSPGSGSESVGSPEAPGGRTATPSEKAASSGRGSDEMSAEAAGEAGARKAASPGGESLTATTTAETALSETTPRAQAAAGQDKGGQGIEERREAGAGEKGTSLSGETVASARRESSGETSQRPGSKGSGAKKDTQGGEARESAAGGGQPRQGPEQGGDTQKGAESEGSAAKAESGGSKAAASPSGNAASGQSKQGAAAESPKGAEGQSSGSSGAGAGPSQGAGEAAKGSGKGTGEGKPQERGASKEAKAGGSQGKSGQGEAGAKAEAGGAASSTPGVSGGTRGERPVAEAAPITGEKAPLEPRTAGVTKSDEARIAATRDLVSRLTREIATGSIDAGVMKDLGWQPSDMRTFVRKYADALAELPPAPFEGQITLEGGIDAGEVRQGERGAGTVGSVDTAGNAAKEVTGPTGDKIPREEVSPQYRKTVDEYYRSLAGTGK